MTTAMREKIADARHNGGNANNILLPDPIRPSVGELQELPIESVQPAEDNLRGDVGDVAELAQSIAQAGILEPLIVTPRDGTYLIVAGARRHAAALAAGLKTVPAIVRDFDERERVEAMAIENLHREDLTALEEAQAYQRLLDIGGTQRDLAKRVGRSQGHVSKRLALLKLPEEAHAAVVSGGITLEDAQKLTRLVELGATPKRLKRVVDDAARYGPGQAHYAINGAVRELENDAKADALVRKLKANGDDAVRTPNAWQAPKGYGRVQPWGGDVQMDAAKHAKEPCHAVGVTPEAATIELCSDPARHPQQQQTALRAEPTKEQKKAQQHREELAAALTRRITFLAELVKGKVSKDDIVTLALPAALIFERDGYLEVAARILDIRQPALERDEPIERLADAAENDPYNDIEAEFVEDALNGLAAKSDADRLRATFALVAATIEDDLSSYWSIPSWKNAGAYFALLERHGYEISKAERAELDGKAPR